MIDISDFSSKFFSHTEQWDWEVEGFLDTNGHVHPIDIDTKVISTVFERLSSPVIHSIAKDHNYYVEIANQTTYPDFTLSNFDEDTNLIHRIAIDIKTTYQSPNMIFTLGGYNSFLKNDTKNILHPYSSYHEHWIIGFIYKRNEMFKEYDLQNMPKKGDIPCPYKLVTLFIRNKYEITGLRAGSGNTKNIGSVKLSKAELFSTTNGPFTHFNNPKKACDKYWRNYEKYSREISTLQDLLNHDDFKEL